MQIVSLELYPLHEVSNPNVYESYKQMFKKIV